MMTRQRRKNKETELQWRCNGRKGDGRGRAEAKIIRFHRGRSSSAALGQRIFFADRRAATTNENKPATTFRDFFLIEMRYLGLCEKGKGGGTEEQICII